jgi:hypothetical protein
MDISWEFYFVFTTIEFFKSAVSMDDLKSLMEEISSHHSDGVSITELENYCKRYMHYYHLQIERQPSRFYGAWGWSEARRREFRKAFDATQMVCIKR